MLSLNELKPKALSIPAALLLVFMMGCGLDYYPFTLPNPTLTSITPGAAVSTGGSSVVITGSHFRPGAVALIDGVPCQNSTVVDVSQIICIIPPNSGSIASVTASVQNSDGQAGSLANSFVYLGSPGLWLSASQGVTQSGGLVSAWSDQSGTSNHATQAGVPSMPTYAASSPIFNNLPAIIFSGSKYLSLTNLALYQNVTGGTWILAASAANLVSDQYIFSYSRGTASGQRFKGAISDTGTDIGTPTAGGPIQAGGRRLDAEASPQYVTGGGAGAPGGGMVSINTAFSAAGIYDWGASSITLRVNRAQANASIGFQTPGSTSNAPSTAAFIGGTTSFFFNGSLAEIILYANTLTNAQVQVIENYLKTTYNLP